MFFDPEEGREMPDPEPIVVYPDPPAYQPLETNDGADEEPQRAEMEAQNSPSEVSNA
jgi:hypothetical protein